MRIGIIGASGHWAYALEELKNHSVCGICAGFEGEDISSVEKTLSDNNVPFQKYEKFEDFPQIDVAIVNTRFDLNAHYTKECLKKNIYVFSEKPLALSLEETEEIENIATDAFVTCMFGISYEGWCLTLKNAAEQIGTVRMINGRKSYKLGQRPDFYRNKATFGGILPWVGIHAMHWIYFVTGLKFKEVRSFTSNSENFGNGDLETCAVSTFIMENGAIATVSADYYRPASAKTWDDDRLRIVGTKGILEYEKGKVSIIDGTGERELPLLSSEDIFKLFIDRINGKNTGISMEESLYITKVALKSDKVAERI